MKLWKQINDGKPVENTLYYHYARLIENLFAVEKVAVLLNDPDILSTDILNTRHDFKGDGVGVIEAPRGTLIHHYWAKENGQLEKVNLIVSTGHNNWAMSNCGRQRGQDLHLGPRGDRRPVEPGRSRHPRA